jgi:hypothetical protein
MLVEGKCDMTHLCTPIFVRNWAQAREDAVRAVGAGADMVEYRIDAITDEEMIRNAAGAGGITGWGACQSCENGLPGF